MLNKEKFNLKRVITDFSKFYKYVIYQAKADLKAEVANSYLNWLWWILDPLFFMLIYTFVSVIVFKTSEPYFIAFVFIGLTLWNFFQRAVIQSTEIVRSKRMLILRVYIPKYMLLLSKLLVNCFKMIISFTLVVLTMFFYHITPNLYMLLALPIILNFCLVTFGISSIMLHFGVLVEDLKHVTEIILKLLFYFSGIFYSISERLPEPLNYFLLRLNPMAYHIDALRNVLLYHKPISFRWLSTWTIIGILCCYFGIRLIYQNENNYAKMI